MLKPKHACTVKTEVLKSWTLEIDCSRAPCLGADKKTRGLWERDCKVIVSENQACVKRNPLVIRDTNLLDHRCTVYSVSRVSQKQRLLEGSKSRWL